MCSQKLSFQDLERLKLIIQDSPLSHSREVSELLNPVVLQMSTLSKDAAEPYVSFFLKVMQTHSRSWRQKAVACLGKTEATPHLLKHLGTFLQDSDKEVQRLTVKAIGSLAGCCKNASGGFLDSELFGEITQKVLQWEQAQTEPRFQKAAKITLRKLNHGLPPHTLAYYRLLEKGFDLEREELSRLFSILQDSCISGTTFEVILKTWIKKQPDYQKFLEVMTLSKGLYEPSALENRKQAYFYAIKSSAEKNVFWESLSEEELRKESIIFLDRSRAFDERVKRLSYRSR